MIFLKKCRNGMRDMNNMENFRKVKAICPNCGSYGYIMSLEGISKVFTHKCTNCGNYFTEHKIYELSDEEYRKIQKSKELKNFLMTEFDLRPSTAEIIIQLINDISIMVKHEYEIGRKFERIYGKVDDTDD